MGRGKCQLKRNSFILISEIMTHFCNKCMAVGAIGGDVSKSCDYPPHNFVPITGSKI